MFTRAGDQKELLALADLPNRPFQPVLQSARISWARSKAAFSTPPRLHEEPAQDSCEAFGLAIPEEAIRYGRSPCPSDGCTALCVPSERPSRIGRYGRIERPQDRIERIHEFFGDFMQLPRDQDAAVWALATRTREPLARMEGSQKERS